MDYRTGAYQRRGWTAAERFMNLVQVSSDGCWEWKAYRNRNGYGTFNPGTGKPVLAHHFSYFLAHGVMPKLLRHTCDNPGCVRPDHLREGTQADNVQDQSVRGRHRYLDRDTCKHGHPWADGDFTVQVKNGKTYRRCKACRRERAQ